MKHADASTSAQTLLEEIEFLFEKYSSELRATTQPYQLRRVQGNVSSYRYHPDDVLVRETLMEHIGSTPVVATAFYPYIDDQAVDLGQSLTMLAIHDIGELIEGDVMTFIKNDSAKDPEHAAALSLLHPTYHDLYNDVESQTSQSAKFAKAIDKITPDIVDFLTPADITVWRFQHFVGIGPDEIVPLIEKKKRPYMLWNPFMTEFHSLLLDRLAVKISAESSK
ncbi:MAG TPA: HD domain-containing protein [Candidatus Saccharimonadales bacterium]|nr:HD domain-containing protein [Candidatus Saccharimonadales bacterium]